MRAALGSEGDTQQGYVEQVTFVEGCDYKGDYESCHIGTDEKGRLSKEMSICRCCGGIACYW